MSNDKRVDIKTSEGLFCYKISESGGKYSVSFSGRGLFDSWSRLGTTRSFEDAIDLAKSSSKGSIRNVEIR